MMIPRSPAALALLALLFLPANPLADQGPASGPFETFQVTLQGVLPFTDFDPWMAGVWGYELDARAFALACQGNALRVVDVTNPAAPFTASLVPAIGTDLKEVKTYLHYAYCVNQAGHMQVVDLADPDNAVTVGEIGNFTGSHNVYIETTRGLLFICGHSDFEGFQVFDLNVDPVDPPLVGVYGQDYCHDIHVKGGLALVCAVFDGYFELVDVSNLNAIQRLSTFTHPGPLMPHAGWFSSDLNYVFTTDEAEGGHLIAWDISNRTSPFPVSSYEVGTGHSSHNVVVKENYAYVSYFDQGVRILDVSDPPNMFQVGYIDSPLFDENSCYQHPIFRGIWGVHPLTTAGNFYFGNMCGGGIYIARFEGPATGFPTGPAGPAVSRMQLLPNAPNPFSAETTIPFLLAQPGPVRVRIFDLAGRVVADLGSGDRTAGRHEVRWDGRRMGGGPAPAGVYWVELDGPGGKDAARLVRTR